MEGKLAPAVSVIIATRNRLDYLREAVASVIAQPLAPGALELCVVDDASEDGTWQWLQAQSDPMLVRMAMERQRERSAARNAGLREARGEFVLFLDDDRLLPGALSVLLQALRGERAAIAAVGGALTNTPEGDWVPVPQISRRRRVRRFWREVVFGFAPVFGMVLARKSAVMEAGGWNEQVSLAEDFDPWLRLSRLGPVVFLPELVLAYRVHPGQTPRTNARAHSVALLRAAMRNLDPRERKLAERSIRAQSHKRKALAEYQRERYRSASRHYWLAIRRAPWLLASPLCRRKLVGRLPQSLVRVWLGEGGYRLLRRAKNAWIRILGKSTGRAVAATKISKGSTLRCVGKGFPADPLGARPRRALRLRGPTRKSKRRDFRGRKIVGPLRSE